jgi:hypothetical protein
MDTHLPMRATRRTTIIVVVAAALAIVVASVLFVTTVLAAPPTPTPSITSGPANPTNVTSATFAFTDSAPGATFQCALDGSAFAACTSPKSYPGPLANGTHTFSVRAQKSNAAQSAAATSSWRVDTVAPSLSTINRADADPARTGPLHWTVTFNEPVSGLTVANLDVATSGLSGGAPVTTAVAPVGSAPTPTWTATVTTSGTTAVNGTIGLNLVSTVSVNDAAGNALGAILPVAGQAYIYDTTAPVVASISRADANPAASGPLHWTVTFGEAVNGVASPSFGLATSGLTGTSPSISAVTPVGSAPASTWTVTVATSGTSTAAGTIGLNLTAIGTIRDAAGNALHASPPIAGPVYAYDTVAPAVTLTKVNGAGVTFPLSTTATVTSFAGACGRAIGDSPSVYVSITGSALQSAVVPCTTAGTWSFSTSPSLSTQGTFRATATQPDAAGNTGSSGERTVVIDRTPPAAPIFTNTPTTTTDKTQAQFGWYDTEQGVSFVCSLDGAGTSSCSSSGVEYKNLAVGNHCFAVTALDAAGNASAPSTFCWTITSSTDFLISGGALQPLYPGGPAQSLNLSISNSNSFAIRITALTATIRSQTLNGTCSTSANFTVVHNLLVSVVIPAHSTKSLSDLGVATSDRPQIRMIDTNVNQDSCRGANLQLVYSGSAVKA